MENSREVVHTALSFFFLCVVGFVCLNIWFTDNQTEGEEARDLTNEIKIMLNEMKGEKLDPIVAKTLDGNEFHFDSQFSDGNNLLILLSAVACNKVQISEMREITERYTGASDPHNIVILYHNTGQSYHDRRDLAILKKVTNVPFTVAYTEDITYHNKFRRGIFPVYLQMQDGVVKEAWSSYTDQDRIYGLVTGESTI